MFWFLLFVSSFLNKKIFLLKIPFLLYPYLTLYFIVMVYENVRLGLIKYQLMDWYTVMITQNMFVYGYDLATTGFNYFSSN